MAWTHHHLKFRLLSPMHIGYRKVGNLMQTRQYVLGKNLWAALTARLTRDYHDGSKGKEYEKIGCLAIKQFRFGYLWPSLDGINPCYFWREDFDYLFLDSYASTALDYFAHSTKEGSLHETEFIAPVARNGRSVYLLGDLWEKEGEIAATSWQSSMKNLQLGGERTYGWGRLSLCSDRRENSSENAKTATGHRWQEEGGEVVLTLNKGDRITAHALAASSRSQGSGYDSRCIDEILASVEACDGGLTNNVEGPVEPMVGREWSAFAGQKVCYGGVYFMPGCKIKDANDQAKFIIDAFGRWISYKR